MKVHQWIYSISLAWILGQMMGILIRNIDTQYNIYFLSCLGIHFTKTSFDIGRINIKKMKMKLSTIRVFKK